MKQLNGIYRYVGHFMANLLNPLKSLFAGAVLLVALPMSAQNLASIGREKPLTISGGVSINQIVYGVNGIESRRDPYSFFASGNLNFNLYGWSVPLSFTYSNQQTSFRQPFNQYGLHPTYKWVTAHVGYSSMNFSPYTLGGHLFLGAGVDATPGKWKFSAMYGRLLAAVEPDSTVENGAVPAFRRMGFGFRAAYADGNDQAAVILFRAKDDINSIAYVPENEGILPEENLVLSIMGSKEILEKFVLKAEYAISGITHDLRSEEVKLSQNRIFAQVGDLFRPRLSSSYYNAFKSALTYRGSLFSVGLGFERIDPGYRTLGAYYFNNDLINYTVNAATAFFGGKLNVAANLGLQSDNLNGQKISTMDRNVGSINLAFAASERLNLTAAYSNFTTFTNIRSQFLDINELTPYDNLDTLNFTQISQNATFGSTYRLGNNENRRQNLNVNLNFQDAADEQGGVKQNSGSQFYMANAAWSMSLVPKNMTIAAAFNYNLNTSVNIETQTFGPTLSVSRSFLDRQLRTSLAASWNGSYTNNTQVSRVMNLRANAGYSINKVHNLNLGLVLVNRSTHSEGPASAFTEFTGTLGYSYSFSTGK
jgi:hypothetical protein